MPRPLLFLLLFPYSRLCILASSSSYYYYYYYYYYFQHPFVFCDNGKPKLNNIVRPSRAWYLDQRELCSLELLFSIARYSYVLVKFLFSSPNSRSLLLHPHVALLCAVHALTWALFLVTRSFLTTPARLKKKKKKECVRMSEQIHCTSTSTVQCRRTHYTVYFVGLSMRKNCSRDKHK